MNSLAVIAGNLLSGIGGAITAVYIILGVSVALGAFSLIRLALFAKKMNLQAPSEKNVTKPSEESLPAADDGRVEELEKALAEEQAARRAAENALAAEKEAEAEAALSEACEKCREEQKQQLAALEEKVQSLENALAEKEAACEKCREAHENEVAALNEKINELESAPAPEPEIKTVIVEVEKERTLKESLSAAKEVGAIGTVSKKSIIEYLSAKYGNTVELNGRQNRTENGKLLVSDNHFAFAPDGKRVCFTYVYETDEGHIVSLIKLDAAYAGDLAQAHKEVSHSRFPKNKENDWYSVVADDSFTAEAYYAVFDHAIERITGKEEEPMRKMSLKEGLAAAKEVGAVGTVSKKSIIEHLEKTFGDKVEINGRKNRTDNGKLLVSDNHFALPAGGKKVCFTYVYEDDDGKITLLVRESSRYAKALAKAHKSAVYHSAFPKNKDADWYGVVVDQSFTENGVYEVLDRAAERFLDEAAVESEVAATVAPAAAIPAEPAPVEEAPKEETPAESAPAEEPAVTEAPAEEPAEEPEAPAEEEEEPEGPLQMQEIGLKEGLAAAKEMGAVGTVTKASIIEHLSETYGDRLALFGRKKKTENGKLYVPDNHFALKDGGQVCFAYVYEDDDGYVLLLVREPQKFVRKMRDIHGDTVTRSAFPKNKANDWYSFIVDEKYTQNEVWEIFDKAIEYVLGL